MIGKLIPAGTGMKRYGEVEVDYGEYDAFVNGKEDEEIHIEGLEEMNVAPEGEEEIKVYGEVAIIE
jgi:DNA-directed RNA polymerase subunit beta'